jgi:signal transduction histidine kinase
LTRITQVLSNLLNNAAKYTPQGGRIGLSVRVEEQEAIISVVDNGVGIAAEYSAASKASLYTYRIYKARFTFASWALL